MTRSLWRCGWLAAVAAVAAGLPTPGCLTAQVMPVRRETVAVESSPVATRLVQTVLDLADDGEWDRALDVLQELESRDPGALAEVEPRCVVRASLAAQVLRTQFPGGVLASYRNRVDLAAREMLNQGTVTEDVDRLGLVLQRYSSSSVAGEAVERLAELRWRDGKVDHATALWGLLIPSGAPQLIDAAAPLRIPTNVLTSADLAARLTLAELVDHDWVRVQAWLDRLEQEHPDARGILGGREGRLTELLRELRETEVTVSRLANAPASGIEDRRLLWVSSLPPDPLPRLNTRPMLAARRLSEVAPAVSGRRLFWSEPGGIRGVRDDGAPLWPAGEFLNDDLVYESDGNLKVTPDLPLLGQGLRQVSVDGGRLLALMGPQIGIEGQREPRPLESRLVCLDVAEGEGKLLWARIPAEVLPSDEWRFSGPPVVQQSRVYVPIRRARPINGVGVVCLDAQDGSTLWSQPVAGLLSEPPETYHRATADALTIAYERVFLGGDFGATACLDARTGQVEWIRSDEPIHWQVPPRVPAEEVPGRRPLCHRGRVFTIEQDDSTVRSVDAWTGAELWRRTIPSQLAELVAVRHGRVYAVGDQLWALDLETGVVEWRFGVDDVEGEFIGQAVLVASGTVDPEHHTSLLACTPDELWQVSALSGAPERRIPLRELYNLAGGRLIPLSDRLLIVTPEMLAMLGFPGLATPEARP